MEKTLFSTRDIYLASTLITLKFYMIGIDYQIEGDRNRPVGYFRFEDTASLKDAIQKYMQGLLSVEPKTFITNLHSLKSSVTNTYNNPHNQVEELYKK